MNFKPRAIWNFQAPLPGELFTHTIARTRQNTRSLSDLQFKSYVFSDPKLYRLAYFFPYRLGNLCENLNNALTVEQIIQNHTPYKYFSPFIRIKQKEKIKEQCGKTDREYNFIENWVFSGGVGYYYCPKCIKEDQEKYHCVYPHLEWCLPGIRICLKHRVYLIEYPFSIEEIPKQNFICFDYERIKDAPEVKCKKKHENNLANLAVEVLGLKDEQFSHEILSQKLRLALSLKGYACHDSKGFKYDKLYTDLENYYSVSFLQKYGCWIERPVKARDGSWLSSLLTSLYSPNSIRPNPFHWLLLINFLCSSLNEFLSLDENLLVAPQGLFTESNFDCPNPFCSDPQAHKEIFKVINGREGILVDLRCPNCNTIYSISSINKIPSLQSISRQTCNCINNFLNEGGKKSQICEMFHVSTTKLYFLLNKTTEMVDQEISEAKELVERLIKQNPVITRGEFYKKYERSYVLLKQYDSKWLDSALPSWAKISPPQHKKKYKPKDPALLEQEDLNYLHLAKQIVGQLIQARPPIKITLTSITDRMNISKETAFKYPKTEKYIRDNCESNKEFRIRSCRMKIDDLVKEGQPVTKEILRTVLPKSWATPQKNEIINLVLSETDWSEQD